MGGNGSRKLYLDGSEIKIGFMGVKISELITYG